MKLRYFAIPLVAVGLLALVGPLTDTVINSRGSLFLNIDSDNNDTTKVLEIVRDTTGAVGGTALVTVQENGNVGIGTTNPTRKLSVAGFVDADVGVEAPARSVSRVPRNR